MAPLEGPLPRWAPFCAADGSVDAPAELEARPASSVPDSCPPAFSFAANEARPPEDGRYPIQPATNTTQFDSS